MSIFCLLCRFFIRLVAGQINILSGLISSARWNVHDPRTSVNLFIMYTGTKNYISAQMEVFSDDSSFKSQDIGVSRYAPISNLKLQVLHTKLVQAQLQGHPEKSGFLPNNWIKKGLILSYLLLSSFMANCYVGSPQGCSHVTVSNTNSNEGLQREQQGEIRLFMSSLVADFAGCQEGKITTNWA